MANSDNVFGARLVQSGNEYRIRRYSIPASDSTATFVGDFVKSNGTADTDGTPQVVQAAAGDTLRGVVVAVEPETQASTLHRAASDQRYVLVCDDPDAVFEIQEDGAMAVTAVGGNADVVVAAGNTTFGTSGMELDSSSAVTTTAQLRILGLVQREDNEVGTNGKWLVKINEHELGTSGGSGV